MLPMHIIFWVTKTVIRIEVVSELMKVSIRCTFKRVLKSLFMQFSWPKAINGSHNLTLSWYVTCWKWLNQSHPSSYSCKCYRGLIEHLFHVNCLVQLFFSILSNLLHTPVTAQGNFSLPYFHPSETPSHFTSSATYSVNHSTISQL
jgi:hypothetical protein